MSEKRFDVVMNEFDEVEYITDIVDYEDRDFADFIEFANEMAKENEQLKQSYKEFEDECQSTFNAMSRKQNDLYRKNFKLKEENEELKQALNRNIEVKEFLLEEELELNDTARSFIKEHNKERYK